MIKDVLVILQTHSKGDSQHYLGLTHEERFVNAPKSEITRRCIRSLVESINYAKELFLNCNFNLVVFDDHSDQFSIDEIKNNLNIAVFQTEFIELDTHGIMPSLLRCYEHGRDFGKEIVYFAQDDYLYDTTAIYDMIHTLMETSVSLNNYTCIYPFNDPYKYAPINTGVQSHIIRCQGRHWRTLPMTSCCFMTHHDVIKINWDLFEAMGKHPVDKNMEDNTINKLFRNRGYYLFVPIPSLALHMQYLSEKDDFIDWRNWWDRYDRPERLTPTLDDTVLNVGFGGISIDNQKCGDVFRGMREITLDIDSNFNPNILADVTDISHIPDNYVNGVYLSHMIEHIDYFKVPIVIKELLRVCKPGGFVRILTPNLQLIGEKVVSGDLLDVIYESASGPISAIDIIYGYRFSIHKNRTDFMHHRTGFSKKVFEHIAKEHNLNIDVKEVELDLLVDIKKEI